MSKTIDFAEDLSFPLDVATQTLAFIARKRAGKSYAAGKMIEGLAKNLVQFVIIDPVGNWYGLRLDADGKSPGLDIPVLGGLRGDIPLDPNSGKLVADTIIDTGRSFILDVSQFSLAERKRFVTALGEQLWLRQKGLKDPQPVHVVLEEAQLFLPQNIIKGDEHMVGIWTEIVRLGGNKGIGVTLITQRPQSVAKEALTQVECLVVLQVNGVPEKKALKEWIVEHEGDVNLLDELPFLKQGTAYVWSPQWLEHFGKHAIGKKWTFDAGATPKVGVKKVQAELKPIDLEALRSQMAETVKKLEENDPKALKKRVAELEKRLVSLMTAAQKQLEEKPAGKTERVEVPVLTDAEKQLIEKNVAAAEKLQEKATAMVEKLGDTCRDLSVSMKELATSMHNMASTAKTRLAAVPPPPKFAPRPATKPAHTNGAMAASKFQAATPKPLPKPAPVEHEDGSEVKLGRGPRDMLKALASRYPDPLTTSQAATLARVKLRKSTFRNAMSSLRTAGFIREEGDMLYATEAGIAYLGDDVEIVAPTTEELLAMWGRRLPPKVNEALRILAEVHPNALTHEEFGERTQVDITKSTYRNLLSKLRMTSLVVTTDNDVRASDTLFPS
jgi:uncharacterized protein